MDLKKIFSDAGTTFTRVVQQAEEKLLSSEKTEYDQEYQTTVKKLESLRYWTDRFMVEASKVLEPNMANRLENKVMEKMEKAKERATPLEIYGGVYESAAQPMAQYSAEFSKFLNTFGNIEVRVGVTGREFQKKAAECYVEKLKYMLENDIKKYQTDHAQLENLRLDLDAAKAKVRKAKDAAKSQADDAYENARLTFEEQLEKNKLNFKGIDDLFKRHQDLMKAFIEAQKYFYKECLKELERIERSNFE